MAALAIKKYSPEISAVLGIAAAVLVLVTVFADITPIINEIHSLVSKAGINDQYGVVLLKTTGVCAACGFTADSCRDTGHASLAFGVELCARLTILLLALPMLGSILSAAGGLLGS